ncbi:MAG: hypothetical protein ACLSGS_11070 [Adlercreutzia sp.]
MQRTWENVTIDNDVLIGYILGITVLMLAALPLGAYHGTRPSPAQRPDDVGRASLDGHHDLAGPKGTITLAVAFTIPFSIRSASCCCS